MSARLDKALTQLPPDKIEQIADYAESLVRQQNSQQQADQQWNDTVNNNSTANNFVKQTAEVVSAVDQRRSDLAALVSNTNSFIVNSTVPEFSALAPAYAQVKAPLIEASNFGLMTTDAPLTIAVAIGLGSV